MSTREIQLTLDNTSPLIHFSPQGAWGGDRKTDATYIDSYSNSTFSATERSNATATLQFNGTEITVYGAKRDNHGTFTVTLDNSPTVLSGYAKPFEFQQVLFQAKGLNPSIEHEIILMNTPSESGKTWVDIDYVSITQTVAADAKTMPAEKFDCQPSGAWTDLTQDGGTYRQSLQSAAYCTIHFSGPSVSLYGWISSSQNLFTASLDGIYNPLAFNTSAVVDTKKPTTLLYEATGLVDGDHELTVTVQGDGSNSDGYLTLGYAMVDGGDGIDGEDDGLSTGAIAGIAIGAILGIFLLLALIWFIRRRRGSSLQPTTFTMARGHNGNKELFVPTTSSPNFGQRNGGFEQVPSPPPHYTTHTQVASASGGNGVVPYPHLPHQPALASMHDLHNPNAGSSADSPTSPTDNSLGRSGTLTSMHTPTTLGRSLTTTTNSSSTTNGMGYGIGLGVNSRYAPGYGGNGLAYSGTKRRMADHYAAPGGGMEGVVEEEGSVHSSGNGARSQRTRSFHSAGDGSGHVYPPSQGTQSHHGFPEEDVHDRPQTLLPPDYAQATQQWPAASSSPSFADAGPGPSSAAAQNTTFFNGQPVATVNEKANHPWARENSESDPPPSAPRPPSPPSLQDPSLSPRSSAAQNPFHQQESSSPHSPSSPSNFLPPRPLGPRTKSPMPFSGPDEDALQDDSPIIPGVLGARSQAEGANRSAGWPYSVAGEGDGSEIPYYREGGEGRGTTEPFKYRTRPF